MEDSTGGEKVAREKRKSQASELKEALRRNNLVKQRNGYFGE